MDEQLEQEAKDGELAHEISRHLHNSDIGELHVSVKGGYVTVSGTVDNFSDKRTVTTEIQGFGGVRGVTNLIKVIGESVTPVDSDSNI